MKEWICAAAGTVGGLIAGLFGGWDAAIRALLVFMAIDYLMGLACAEIFQKSPITESGDLQSKVGWKGLCRKVATLALVVVAVQVDAVLHTSYVRDGGCIAFMANELISMVENVGLMGVQFPEPLRKAIDLLQKKYK